MKILKVFGIVVGIHVFALMLIFANPGCSSSSKPPAATETVAKTEAPAPAITVPTIPAPAADPVPAGFNPDAPATAAPASGGIRFTPTRPNTAAASTLTVEPVKDVTPMSTYTVKSGDSLWTIANKNKISVADLAAANNLKSNTVLKLGQKLIIPGKNPAPAPAPAPAMAAPAVTTAAPAAPTETPAKGAALHHKVATGETLGSIALKYGVRERDLALVNNITDPRKLPLGKDLIIPGWDSTASKSSKSTGKAATAPKTTVEKTTPAPEPAVPVISIGSQPAATPSSDVPVIRVDEAPKKP